MTRRAFIVLPALAALLFAAPALAHEHQTFHIGDKVYEFTIGSLNEPVYVDDKTGVELNIALMKEGVSGHDDHDVGHVEAGTPIDGLDQTLKVEIIAGDKRRIFDLAAAYGAPGSYRAAFYPTVATTLSYRVFGTLDGTPIDLTFTCNPAGHPASPDDASVVTVGEGVTRIKKTGSFGCPRPKSDAAFPETVGSLKEISDASSEDASEKGSDAAPLALGALGTVLGAAALVQGRKKK